MLKKIYNAFMNNSIVQKKLLKKEVMIKKKK